MSRVFFAGLPGIAPLFPAIKFLLPHLVFSFLMSTKKKLNIFFSESLAGSSTVVKDYKFFYSYVDLHQLMIQLILPTLSRCQCILGTAIPGCSAFCAVSAVLQEGKDKPRAPGRRRVSRSAYLTRSFLALQLHLSAPGIQTHIDFPVF